MRPRRVPSSRRGEGDVSHVEPTEKEILHAFKGATGKDLYDDRDDPVLEAVKINYDDSNPGLWIVDGAEQVWKVKVRYE